MLKIFVQGESPESDHELFCLIGAWAISEKVHEQLGMAITGRFGDIWLVEIAWDKPMGFAQLRILKNRKAHLRYVFALEGEVRMQLIRDAMTVAQERQAESIYTNDRKADLIWPTLAWEQASNPERGEFCRWERNFL